AEVVEHHDLVAGAEQLLGDDRADVAGAAGDEELHGRGMLAATLMPMRPRMLGAVLAVAAIVAVSATPASAQTPTPTPTPTPTVTPTPTPTVTPTPTPDPVEEKKERLRKRKVVKRVYRDYRQDGLIDNCRHSRLALKRTLQSISDECEADFPDFREAVKAAIKDWDKDRCEREAEPTP